MFFVFGDKFFINNANGIIITAFTAKFPKSRMLCDESCAKIVLNGTRFSNLRSFIPQIRTAPPAGCYLQPIGDKRRNQQPYVKREHQLRNKLPFVEPFSYNKLYCIDN